MIDLAIFATAGNARFTVTSLRTGTRFTFKVRKPVPESPAFVSVLSGPDNDSDYQFLGTIFQDGIYRHGRSSRITPTAPSAVAFDWVWSHRTSLPTDKVEIHHEGRCCRCGRTLTVPASVMSGVGPECAAFMGL